MIRGGGSDLRATVTAPVVLWPEARNAVLVDIRKTEFPRQYMQRERRDHRAPTTQAIRPSGPLLLLRASILATHAVTHPLVDLPLSSPFPDRSDLPRCGGFVFEVDLLVCSCVQALVFDDAGVS